MLDEHKNPTYRPSRPSVAQRSPKFPIFGLKSCYKESACLALLEQWEGLLAQLDHILPRSLEGLTSLTRAELCRLLRSLDSTWADFEHRYIMEIVRVQHEAKGLVAKAIDVEEMLSQIEEEDSDEYQVHLGALVACISQLNVAANLNRKTFDELTSDIWENSAALLKMCSIDSETPLQAVRVVAQQVLLSLEEFRQCLRDMRERGLEEVNPQLCHNEDLVSSLMRWEEAWITGARYIQTRSVLAALCKLLPRLLGVSQCWASFAQMCMNFDAELFLVMPRLVWLSYFESPEGQTALISNLLPHRFVHVPVYSELRQRAGEAQLQRLRRQRSEPALGEAVEPELTVLGTDAALKSMQRKFNEVKLLLAAANRTHEVMGPADAIWGILLQSAVRGTVDADLFVPWHGSFALLFARKGPAKSCYMCFLHFAFGLFFCFTTGSVVATQARSSCLGRGRLDATAGELEHGVAAPLP